MMTNQLPALLRSFPSISVVFVSCAALLGACAADAAFEHPYKSREQFSRDQANCAKNAQEQVEAGKIASTSSPQFNDHVDACLYRIHGWVDLGGLDMRDKTNLYAVSPAHRGDCTTLSMVWNQLNADWNAPAVRSTGWFGKGITALYAAAEQGHVCAVEMLLKLVKVDPSLQLKDDSCCPRWTPVLIASAQRHAKVVAMLIGAGADVNAKNRLGRTAVMFAASYGDAPIAKALLEHGADPNIVPTDGTGLTALMAAVRNGHIEVVQLLLDKGADLSVRDASGATALGWAKRQGNSTLVYLLEALDARD